MADWREMPAFVGVDLEDSFVLGWALRADAFVVDLEASLWPGHPSYEPPLPGSHTCYKPARLVFPAVREISGLLPKAELDPSHDPDGSIDYGTIEALSSSGAQHRIVAEFGVVSLQSSPPLLTITSEKQCRSD